MLVPLVSSTYSFKATDDGKLWMKLAFTPNNETCCGPSRNGANTQPPTQSFKSKCVRSAVLDRISVSAGNGLVGTAQAQIPDDGEAPIRRRKVKPYLIGATTVKNAQFEDFVQATGYQTEAERFGWSFVFYAEARKTSPSSQPVRGLEW
jgi:sulfatase modifying factor 1